MKRHILILLVSICSFANAQYSQLHNFGDTLDGSKPKGALYSDGTFLYGMTHDGGANDLGVVFKMMPDGTGYTKLLDFNGALNGGESWCSFTSDGVYLYGMTTTGGTSNYGTIFKIRSDGTNYTKLHDFESNPDGNYPYGSLISDGTFLYGITKDGGTNFGGTIFKIMPDGTNYVKLHDFMGDDDGRVPYGSLIFDGTFLYGMAAGGGAFGCWSGCGAIFKIKPDGTEFAKILDFSGSNGYWPIGPLISDGIFLYGVTWAGGDFDKGTIFKIMPDGTGYSKLFDFDGTQGVNPCGSLVSDGAFLYGMTQTGGVDGDGTIFRIMPDGTNFANLHDFVDTPGSGFYPADNLILNGSYLYGMTQYYGGSNFSGTIFRYGIVMGISENKTERKIYIFPSPTSGVFTIQANEKITIVEAMNLLGERIYSSETNSTSAKIDLSEKPNGIYFLNIKTEAGTGAKKIIIEK